MTLNTNKIKEKKAIGYVRVSTKKQKKNGISLAAQSESIKKYLNQYNSKNPNCPLKLLEIIDDANSAFKITNNSTSSILLTNRPGMQKLINKIHSEGITDIIIYCRDRLNRNIHEYVAFTAMFEKLGVSLHFTSSNEIVESDISALKNFYESMMANIAMFNAQNITYNCKNALMQVVRNGHFPGGHIPFGYNLEKDSHGKSYLVINKDEADIVEKIFNLYSIGYSYRDILKKLKKETANLRINFNSPSIIEQIINNEIYTGTYLWNRNSKLHIEFNDDIVKSPCLFAPLEIIPKKEYDKVHNIKNTISLKSPRFYSTNFLLNSLLVCENCGSFLKCKNNGKNKSAVYYCKCNTNKWTISIKKEKIEELVLLKIRSYINSLLKNDSIINEYYSKFKEKLLDSKISKEKELSFLQKSLEQFNNNINTANNILKKRDILQSEDPNLYSSDFFEAIESNLTILNIEQKHIQKVIDNTNNELTIKLKTFDEFKNSLNEINLELCKTDNYSIKNKSDVRLFRILLTQIVNKIIVSSNKGNINLSISLVIPNLNPNFNLNFPDTCPISK